MWGDCIGERVRLGKVVVVVVVGVGSLGRCEGVLGCVGGVW